MPAVDDKVAEGKEGGGSIIWKGRPSIGPYVTLFGVLALGMAVVLIEIEFLIANNGLPVLKSAVTLNGFKIPNVLEVGTAAVVILWYVAKLLGLVILRAGNRYELRSDGLYVNKGIANLENAFVSPMAFSDARLIRTIEMRLLSRCLIVVDTNDRRHFELKLVRDGLRVQGLISSTLAHPAVRLDREPGTAMPSPSS